MNQPIPLLEDRSTPHRSQAEGSRLAWVDAARGIGIALVVLGHTVGGLISSGIAPAEGGLKLVATWLYAFHMPLFFFLAGLFVLAPARASTGLFVDSKLRTVAWPYLVWSLIQTAVQISLGAAVNAPVGLEDLLQIPYAPIMQFWFLYALFVIHVLFALAIRWGLAPLAILVVAIGLYIAGGVTPVPDWEVPHKVASHAIYYAAGVVVSAARPTAVMAPLPRPLAFGAAALGWLAVGWGVRSGLQEWLPGALLLALVGIASTILLARTFSGWPSLRELGRLSLAIYVAHTLASAGYRIGLMKLLGVTDSTLHLIGGCLVGILLPIGIARLAERAGWTYAFTLPRRGTPAPAASRH